MRADTLLDATGWKILKELQADGRLSFAELGRRVGLLRGVRANYLAGLGTTLIVVAALRPDLGAALRAAAGTSPLLLAGGGLLGILVVTSMNLIYPRLPAFSAGILIFSGQALAGAAVDVACEGRLDAGRLLGLALVLAGLGLDALQAKAAQVRD